MLAFAGVSVFIFLVVAFVVGALVLAFLALTGRLWGAKTDPEGDKLDPASPARPSHTRPRDDARATGP
jgi:hypothetical protein